MNRFYFPLAILFILTFCGQTVFGDAASDKFASAKAQFDLKNYDQARLGFDDYLLKYPTNAQATEARYYLAESLLYQKQYALAEVNYNQLAVLSLDNQFAKVALFRLADIPYLQGLFDVAKPRLENFIEKLPHDNNLQFVLFYLGDIAMRANANGAEEAEFYFSQCDKMFPNGAKNLETKIGLAWAKNQLGKTTEATNIFQELMSSSNPQVVETATYQWGVAQFERGDFQAASSILTNFQTQYPNSQYFTDSLRVLARCKGSLGDYNGAVQVFSRISSLTTDDGLVKVRCLYGLKQTQQAQNLLSEIERQNDPAYRDEVALLKSVFLFDQGKWQETIFTLESFLFPQYNTQTGRIMFSYLTQLPPAGVQKLNDESFMKACSLLAQAYAKNGDNTKASATLQEMQNQASLLSRNDLNVIVTETQTLLAGISSTPQHPSGRPGKPGRPNDSGLASLQPSNPDGQWAQNGNGNGQWGNGGRQQLPTANGTDLERFNRALQFYNQGNYVSASQQLEQILGTYYNQLTTPKQYAINYIVTGTDGTMNGLTFAKACSLLALSKAQQGDIEQANAVFSTFASKINLTDVSQKGLLQETSDQLAVFTKTAPDTTASKQSLLSEVEQRKLLRDCNSYYNSKKYDLVVSKTKELINLVPTESVEAEATMLQSKALYNLGKEAEAVALLDKVANDYSASTVTATQSQYQDALWHLGNYYDSYGDMVKSVEYFQLLADRFPNSKRIDGALYFLAVDDLTNGTGRKATSYLTRVYKNYQAGEYWSHATWMLAYETYKKKDYTQSEIYLQKLLQHPPDVVILDRVLYLKGILALQKNEYDTAFVAFRDIGKNCPDSPLCDDAARNAHIAAGKAVSVR